MDGAPPAKARTLLQRLPLRIRLTLWVIMIWAVVQGTLGLVLFLYEQESTNEFFNTRLMARASSVLEVVRARTPAITDAELVEITREQLNLSAFATLMVTIYDDMGRVVATSARPTVSLEDIPGGGHSFRGTRIFPVKIETDEHTSSIFAKARSTMVTFMGQDGQPYHLLTAASDEYARRMLAATARGVIVTGLAGVLAAGLAGWFLAGIAVAPLQRATRTIRQLAPDTIRTALEVTSSGSEANRLQSELEDARQRIVEGFRAQERFISNVSHEIKTPIATLLTEAQTLPDLDQVSDEVRNYIRSSREEMRKLGELVDSFLLLSRVQDGKRELPRLVSYPLNELIVDAIVDCNPMAAQYGVKLVPTLMDDDEGLTLAPRGNPDLLRTMLNNLIRNAIRFSPRDLTVEVSASHAGNEARLAVRDFGPGIPEEYIDRIFDRFVQVPGQERRGRGHGLGLAIAQGIAELHQAGIKAENSNPGCRFTVTFRVPTGPEASATSVSMDADQKVEDHAEDGEKKNDQSPQ